METEKQDRIELHSEPDADLDIETYLKSLKGIFKYLDEDAVKSEIMYI